MDEYQFQTLPRITQRTNSRDNAFIDWFNYTNMITRRKFMSPDPHGTVLSSTSQPSSGHHQESLFFAIFERGFLWTPIHRNLWGVRIYDHIDRFYLRPFLLLLFAPHAATKNDTLSVKSKFWAIVSTLGYYNVLPIKPIVYE